MNALERAEIVASIQRDYKAATNQKTQLQLLAQFRKAERYWQADQWPETTPRTFPRPVLNLVFEFVERKVAIVTGKEPRITYQSRMPATDEGDTSEGDARAEVLDVAAEWEWDRTRLDELYDSVLRTAALMGTAIVQTSYDPDATGGSQKAGTLWKGGLVETEIDPENFAPGDATIPNVQSQPFIVTYEEMPVDTFRDTYRDWAKEIGVDVDEIAASGGGSRSQHRDEIVQYPQEAVERPDTVFVVRRWWKDDGQLNYAVAGNGQLVRYKEGIYENGLYPYKVLRWYPRRKSFWGMSEFAQLLPNQESINRLLGFLIQSAQLTGMPQKRVKQAALPKGFVPTNDPGQIIPDMTPGNSWGIDYLQPPSVPPYVQGLIDYMVQRIRGQQGILDAITGQAPSGDLNATAIAYLQQAAAVLMGPVIRRAHVFLSDMGRLWFAFWTEPDLFHAARTLVTKNSRRTVKEFRGDEYADEEYDVIIATDGGDTFDMAAQAQMAQELKAADIIDADEALMAIPAKLFPAKDEILERRRQIALAQQAALEAQMAQAAGAEGVAQPGEAAVPAPQEGEQPAIEAALGGQSAEGGEAGG